MQSGKIGVTTENIFPIIKKFLYSDHEIFLRELVSNGVDAVQKLKTMGRTGEFKGSTEDLKVWVTLDKENKTITVSDSGIGMTTEEIDKYINQIAFSSAEEFLEKFKDQANAIIGHFGLGFYSAFMVSKKVELITRSYKEGSVAMKWSCDGSPEYTLEESTRDIHGTDIILYIDEESQLFAEENKITELLNKYCKFLPVPIAFGKVKEWKDGKDVETEKENIINNTIPAWTKKPADLKDEDYMSFYRELYPVSEEPLFHIHLNVDYPFNLTGILYFPKIKSNLEINRNKIQLYCQQVFVTDSVEGIVPDFLTLLHGVIDSPDIPLNVSRSYLQSDSNVKKISSHITKKVADRLQEIFTSNRSDFEKKWDNLKLFIEYGMITDEKFSERALKFMLFKNVDGKYFTPEEYDQLIKENQTDKNKKTVYLYSTNKDQQYSFIESARKKGYDVLMLDGNLDAHFINHLESKLKDIHFARVDSDVIDKIIQKDEVKQSHFSNSERDMLTPVFNSQLPEKSHFIVSYEDLSETDAPMLITQSEWMRRMKEMSAVGGGGMNFYGDMPDSYNLVVNSSNPLVKKVLGEVKTSSGAKVSEFDIQIEKLEKEHTEIENINKGKKDDDIPQADKDKTEDLHKRIEEIRTQKVSLLKETGKNTVLAKQLVDLALLSNNMLKGEELNKFVQRSIDLIERIPRGLPRG